MKLSERRELADKILAYLKKHRIVSCLDSYEMLQKIADDIEVPLFEIWKAYDLLRMVGRVELNNPNGRKGFKVLNYAPLSQGIADRPPRQKFQCPLLAKAVKEERQRILAIFKDYDELSEKDFLKKYPNVNPEVYLDGGEFYSVMCEATK